ncbi:nuclear factor related to kappa-B-binding protein-like [Solanum pennellii]|uniref:Nuclear factor related to kappa-B-binding protein-like n=1 Tax=Solanum pennellii TaxID=28526 RepID=A0ABM1H1J7_SOLPN|nr:nuclear factor related to kappa-B-binding protein-like [Solanum pennellii]XP_015079083.1 nuclear factor related to kappa-B-binding protein-like [Solanum pennellii]
MPDKKVNRAAKILMEMKNNKSTDLGERLEDSRAINSPETTHPNSEEIRACFRREEALRYTQPNKAFSYTAVDGKKVVVAPLKKCGGKLFKRICHYDILKRNKPPFFTLHCLVRDAAARLPGGVGTRDDVCVLARDSQFIVEDVSDSQLRKAVKGGLDRLHYEEDP